MKKFALLSLFTLSISILSAQAIGHINTQDLIEILPGKKEADEKLLSKQKDFEKEIKSMSQEFQESLEQAQKDIQSGKIKPEQQGELQAKFEEKQKKISDFQQNASIAIKNQQEELYKPLLDRFKTAVNKIAIKKGLKYVLDASSDSVVLFADGLDITKDVKKELGID